MITRYTYIENTTTIPIEPTANNHAIIDIGATNTFVVFKIKVKNKIPNIHPLLVTVKNGQRVYTTHTCELDIPQLPSEARFGHILQGLSHYSLISAP